MDTLHSNLREITDHRDDVESGFGSGGASVRPLVAKPVVEPTAAGSGWYHDAAIADARQAAVEARCNPYHH